MAKIYNFTDCSIVEELICKKLWESDGYRLNNLLPQFNWRRKGNTLISANYLSGTSHQRADKAKIMWGSENKASLVIAEQGEFGRAENLINWLKENCFSGDYWACLMRLGELCGVQVGTPENIEIYRQKRAIEVNYEKIIENVLAEARTALFTPEGAEVYKYIKGRGTNYPDERIKFEGLGVITPKIAEQLKAFYEYLSNVSKEVYRETEQQSIPGRGTLFLLLNYMKQAKYNLIFGFPFEGRNIGLVVRSLLGDKERELLAEKLYQESVKAYINKGFTREEAEKKAYYPNLPKYLAFFPFEGFTTDHCFFGWDSKEIDITKPVTIVEGGLDCLSAKWLGVKNIVALWGKHFTGDSGGSLTNHCKFLSQHKIQAVNFLLDTEPTTEQRENIFKDVKDHCAKVSACGILAFASQLPAPPNQKQDISNLVSERSKEEAKEILETTIAEAKSISFLEAKKLIDNYCQTEKTPLSRGKFIQAIKALLTSTVDKIERVQLQTFLAQEFGADVACALVQEARETAEKTRRKKVVEASNKGDWDSVRSLLQQVEKQTANSASAINTELQARPKTKDSWIQEYWSKTPGELITNYTVFNNRGDLSWLTFPIGALSVVGGCTSHGKSTLLQNIALDLFRTDKQVVIEKETINVPPIEGRVLYFSLEEARAETELKLLNIFVGTRALTRNGKLDLSKDNKGTLKHYYKHKGESEIEQFKYFSNDTNRDQFKEAEEKFFNDYLLPQRLTVIDTEELGEKTATKIITLVEEIMQTDKVGAVFIDFLQELDAEVSNTTKQRRLELKDSAQLLKDFAVRNSLPVICAVQLNREANSPLTLELTQIAEAIDIPRYCAKAVLMFNSAFPISKKLEAGFYRNTSKETPDLSPLALNLENRRFQANTPGALYITVCKNRGGAINTNAVLKFHGNSGVIEPEHFIDNITENFV